MGKYWITTEELGNWAEVEAASLEDAMEQAYEEAKDAWLSYGGTQGYGQEMEDFLEENPDCNVDDWYEAQEEWAESEIYYDAKDYNPDDEDE